MPKKTEKKDIKGKKVTKSSTPNKQKNTKEVKVAKEDMGKVIGKQGKMAKAIRSIMKAIATREHKKVNVEFLD